MRAYWTAPSDAYRARPHTDSPISQVAGRFVPALCPTTSDITGRELILWTPAKLNLFLEVRGKRPDGFHELETLMLPISLYDTLVVRSEPVPRIALSCRRATGGPVPGLPEDRGNLAYRAADLIPGESGVSLTLVKRIPAEAGMAGGSTDGAAALVGVDAMRGGALSREVLADKAAQLGSDVPFFLAGGAAVCRGRGEQIEKISGLAGLNFVIVKPPEGLSTAAVFKACKPTCEFKTAALLVAALQVRDWRAVTKGMFNRLEEAAESLSPAIARLKRAFADTDVVAHQMSGSGTSYFGLCRSASQARRIGGRMRALNLGQVFVVRSL